jgi:hypothetical protein
VRVLEGRSPGPPAGGGTATDDDPPGRPGADSPGARGSSRDLAPAAAGRRRRTRLRPLLPLAFWAVVLGLAGRVSLETWTRLDPDEIHITLPGLLGVGGLLLVARATDVVGWHRLLWGAGARPRLGATARVYTTAELVRYLPGGVLHFAARYRYSARLGVNATTMVATTAIDLALRLASGLALFALSLPWWPDLPRAYLGLTVVALPALVAGSHPRVLGAAIARAQRRLGRVDDPLVLPYGVLVGAGAINALGWLARGLATWLIAGALADLSGAALPPFVGLTGLSWAVGVLTPISPGGLGAREVAGTALLAPYVPAGVGLVVMLVVRLATMATEFLTAGLVSAAEWLRVGTSDRTVIVAVPSEERTRSEEATAGARPDGTAAGVGGGLSAASVSDGGGSSVGAPASETETGLRPVPPG